LSQSGSEQQADEFTSYHWKLFIFLSVATFFEGYDFLALAQILPEIREEFGLSQGEGGALIAVINVGTVLAYLLVRKADQWGRRRVLTITILGYTCFTVLSGLSQDIYSFAFFQLAARVFLIAEWAISMVYAAEEFPARHRGLMIGMVQAFSTLGAVTCAGVVPICISQTTPEWRTVYFVGAIPLLLLAFARRSLKETRRFQAQSSIARRPPFTRIFKTRYRGRMLKLALIWGLTYICTHNAVVFWKEFAQHERNFTDSQIGLSIMIAALASMPLVFVSGWLLDLIGRRAGAVVIFGVACLGVVGAYSLHGYVQLTIALVFGIYGASAVMPVLNAYTTELFPTELRGDAFAWSNNLFGRIGYVISPLAVGLAAESIGWGPAVAYTAVFPLLALVLILKWLPETRGLSLEDAVDA